MDENMKNIDLKSKKIEDETACDAVGGTEEIDNSDQDRGKYVYNPILAKEVWKPGQTVRPKDLEDNYSLYDMNNSYKPL